MVMLLFFIVQSYQIRLPTYQILYKNHVIQTQTTSVVGMENVKKYRVYTNVYVMENIQEKVVSRQLMKEIWLLPKKL